MPKQPITIYAPEDCLVWLYRACEAVQRDLESLQLGEPLPYADGLCSLIQAKLEWQKVGSVAVKACLTITTAILRERGYLGPLIPYINMPGYWTKRRKEALAMLCHELRSDNHLKLIVELNLAFAPPVEVRRF